jgi:hypothetical protein
MTVYIQLLKDGLVDDSKLFKDKSEKELKKELDSRIKIVKDYGDAYSVNIEYVDGNIKDFSNLQKYIKVELKETLIHNIISVVRNERKAKKKEIVDPLTNKKVAKYRCDPGYKLDSSSTPPTCKKMTPMEIITKQKAVKKGLKTRKQGKEMKDRKAKFKRDKTMKRRKSLGIK